MKRFFLLLLAMLMVLSMVNIGAVAEGDREVVNFWYLWSGIEGEGMERIISAYNASQDVYGQMGGLICVTYSPNMIQLAMQDMVDYLDGKSVDQNHVIPCELVSADNVANYKGFAN